MSLICSETEEYIWSRQRAFAASHPTGQGYAVGEPAIAKIPQSERRQVRCGAMEDGLNVYEGVGSQSSGTWQFSDFKKGKFLFSISDATAKKYLPRTLQRIALDVARDAH